MNAKKAPRRARKQAAPTRTVERDITIAAPVDVVWHALTDAEELTRWFPREARVTLGPGGSIWMRWDDRYDAESLIEVWEPPRHLRIVFPAETNTSSPWVPAGISSCGDCGIISSGTAA